MATAPESRKAEPPNLTLLLKRMQQGDHDAAERAIALVYGELHRIASRELRSERPGHLLQTTALINEAYVRLIGPAAFDIRNRMHFLAVAGQQMRRVLIDYARAGNAQKRGAGAFTVALDGIQVGSNSRGLDLLMLDEALEELGKLDPRAAKVVEIRFFGGYTDQEVAKILGVSLATVRRDWEFARSWLFDRIHDNPHNGKRRYS